MNPREIASLHFSDGRVMQLATLKLDGYPRVNSVYYVTSSNLKAVYWMSEPGRRHSSDSMRDERVAGAVAVKTDHPVIGLQFSGVASEVIDSDEVKKVSNSYNEKYSGAADGFYERFQAGTNTHHLYKMTISSLELFDEVHFPDLSPLVVELD